MSMENPPEPPASKFLGTNSLPAETIVGGICAAAVVLFILGKQTLSPPGTPKQIELLDGVYCGIAAIVGVLVTVAVKSFWNRKQKTEAAK